MELIQRALQRDKLALARLISLVEAGGPEAEQVMRRMYGNTGKARIIGVTGAPGVGKSTLVGCLILEYRRAEKRVGVVAVDPSSPFSGGAILGDRVRMQQYGVDRNVFIRSLATRGHLGGLSRATGDVVRLLDACGMDLVIVETVGAGQAEVDVVRVAETVVLVLAPGGGDDMQLIKAGIMEIADVFVVNKADRENAKRLALEIEMALDLSSRGQGWRPPIVATVATDGTGVGDLARQIEGHFRWLLSSEMLVKRREEQGKEEIRDILSRRVVGRLLEEAGMTGELGRLARCVASRETDPYAAAEALLRGLPAMFS